MSKRIKREIIYMTADPAGNKTAFVMSGAKKSEYSEIAKCLLESDQIDCEQVGFVTGNRSMEMAGQEFCGNATRAFALIAAKGIIDGKPLDGSNITVNVSGSKKPVTCDVDIEGGITRISMPLPKRIKTLKHCDYHEAEGKTVIVMEGIAHLIADGIEYSEENYEKIKEAIISEFDPPALGVMYLDKEEMVMTPVVYVKAVDYNYVEGSCASGSEATAVYLSNDKPDGEYVYELKQPRGTVKVTASIVDNTLANIYLKGPVLLSDPYRMEIEYDAPEDDIPIEDV